MTEQVYDVDWYIRFYEAIPENEWCTGTYFEPASRQFCAVGHLCQRQTLNGARVFPYAPLSKLLSGKAVSTIVVDINDGSHPDYQQSTPKQRILAALYHIKEKQDQAGEAFELRPLALSKTEVEAL